MAALGERPEVRSVRVTNTHADPGNNGSGYRPGSGGA
jgi:hypothetical protein